MSKLSFEFKTAELANGKLFDLWKAAEHIVMFGGAFNIVYDMELARYDDPSAPWPARNLGFEVHFDHVLFTWSEGNFIHSVKLETLDDYRQSEPSEVIMAALRSVYNEHSILCAEVMGMVRLYTPMLIGSRKYEQFDTLMGHNLSLIVAGGGLADDELVTSKNLYVRLMGELLPWGNINNPLAKAMYAEFIAIRKLLDKTIEGWRLKRRGMALLITTPSGDEFEVAYQLFFHVAAASTDIPFDVKSVLNSI